MIDDLVAREPELARIAAFLDRPGDGPAALVLEGVAGIGKSRLWLAGVAAARERSYRVLVSRPAEAEQAMPNVVLGDLFGGIDPGVLAGLPGPRRRAFESALLLQEAPEVPVDPRALGVAILTLLPELAAGRPLVLAIDDDQWLDSTSAATLQFALRRVGEAPLRLLLARRHGADTSTALEDAIDPAAVDRVVVGPLSRGAIQQMLRHQLATTLPRPLLTRIHELSAGNPFYALELARQAGQSESEATEPFAIPPSLEHLVGARLLGLDAQTRDALILVAAHGRLPVALARTLQIASQTLDRARAANVIETEDGVIRFAHPLLASALYQAATEAERRGAHGRLAEVVDDPVHRGRHLALAADAPSAALAAELEAVTGVAIDRGLAIAGAELAEHALRATPPDATDDWHRRAVAVARAHDAAGNGSRARAVAAEILAAATPGRQAAEALMLRSEREPPTVAIATLEQALVAADGEPDLQSTIHATLAEVGFWTSVQEFTWADEHARASLALAERLNDDLLRSDALAILATLRFAHAEPHALELAERAFDLGRSRPRLGQAARTIGSVALVLAWSGRVDPAREWLERRLREWSDRDERARLEILWYLAIVETWAGRWDLAAAYAGEMRETWASYRLEHPYDRFPSAFVALHRGEFEVAREHSRTALELAAGQPLEFYFGILGTCDLWSGDPTGALVNLRRADEAADGMEEHDPGMRFWRADQIEALLQVGRTEDAAATLDEWESIARRLGRERTVANASRCRGLLAIARGDIDAGVAVLEDSVKLLRAAGDPFGEARALLALGAARRRMRQKRTAREAIDAALDGFERLGAASWATAARAELARIGGRQRLEGLSPSEQSVAGLVAEGRTNREIAAAMFLGERTVAGHLTRIYSKLGIRSRTELARTLRMQDDESAGGAGKVERS